MADACAVDGCEKQAKTSAMCSMHYSRKRLTGSVDRTPSGRVVFGLDEVCAVEGCGQKRRKRTWCASHYSQWQRNGEVRPFQYKWANVDACMQCGATKTSRGKFCSDACTRLYKLWGGERPASVSCRRCGDPIDLLTRERKYGKSTRLKRSDSLMCPPCRAARARRHKMSVSVLAKRDGDSCGICGDRVDMTLKHPDIMRASVDHRLPFAKGGTHDPDNLQLSHLRCNVRKQAQLNYQG